MKRAFVLQCDDHSHLGGPMGTEYVTSMWVRIFGTREKAVNYAIKYCKEKGIQDTYAKPKELLRKNSIDMGCIGLSISIKKIG